MKKDQLELILVQGPEGQCVYLGNLRIAGPKPWGGGKTIKKWNVNRSDINEALED